MLREIISPHRSRNAWLSPQQIKVWMARGLARLGLTQLMEIVGGAQLTILTYHRVLPLQDAMRYPFQGMMMPRELFDAQMAHLARNYTVLGLPEAIPLLQTGGVPRRAVVVTFDDGYRDNYEHAWPVLKKYRIPATFYLVTGAIDRRLPLWWDEVAERMQRLGDQRVLPSEKEHSLPNSIASLLEKLRDRNHLQAITLEVVSCLKQTSLQGRKQSLEALRAFSDFGFNEWPDLMLTWEHVRELHDSGMHIGAHTVTHPFLDELDEDEARWEIEASIEKLEERLDVPIRLFSYPGGRVPANGRRILQQAGVEAAVTTEPGRNGRAIDLLDLKRLSSGYFCLGSEFDPALVDAELVGWFDAFRVFNHE